MARPSAERIQSYCRETARRLYEPISVPPFTVFVRPGNDLVWMNYAIPDEPVGGDLSEELERVRGVFRKRDRIPRFEFVEGFAPELAPSLLAAGFSEQLRTPLMTCSSATLAPARTVPGLQVERLTPSSPIEDVQAFSTVTRRAFGSGDEEPADEAEAAERGRRLDHDIALLARIEGEPAAVAQALAPLDGLSEIAGVGTLTEFRTRGIASHLTAEAARLAFVAGAELAFLTPGDDGAFRVYERAGFQTAERMFFFIDE